MKRVSIKILLVCLLLTIVYSARSQDLAMEGIVTFKTSMNIYVRFENTSEIELNDTLYKIDNGTLYPCVIVDKKSTSSCICTALPDCTIEKDQKLIYFTKTRNKKSDVFEPTANDFQKSQVPEIITHEDIDAKVTLRDYYKQKVNGQLSAASYSNFSNNSNAELTRAMVRVSYNIYHINDGKFSFESYLNYSNRFVKKTESSAYMKGIFNVYNAALIYDIDTTSQITLGRRINRKISSLGPIDGLQFEKIIGKFYTGVIIGFRPDITDFSFNSNLFEYGAYIGIQSKPNQLYHQTTFGLLEQRNAGPIDRRYAYAQHSSNITKKLNLFGSVELDLYAKINGQTSLKPRLTNLYVSARYQLFKRLSFMVSFDSRRRIIFYETFQTDIEQLLADDQARQGIRAGFNYRIGNYINGGLTYSKRFQNDQQSASDNISAHISHSKFPVIGGRLYFNFNINKATYFTSSILSGGYSRTIINKFLYGDFYVRSGTFAYGSDDYSQNQLYYGGSLNWRLTKSLRFSILVEKSVSSTNVNNFRFNSRIIKML